LAATILRGCLKRVKMNSSILIREALIVNDGKRTYGDVLIQNGRIEAVARNLAGRRADIYIHAEGKALLPGMIDDHVHFREPGLTHKGDIKSESAAAVAGGITTFMDMPNTKPATLTQVLLEEKFTLAKGRSHANYSFYLGASNDNIDQIIALDPQKACGIKLFMGSSTGNMLVDDPLTLETIFERAPVLVAAHCEDTPTILANENHFRKIYQEKIPIENHSKLRSREACLKSATLAVELAKAHGARLHILHISTEEELDLFKTTPLDQKKITAEACVHHLHFTQADYAAKGTLIKCNPAIKKKRDRDALIEAVKNGKIDVVATDHAPHTLSEKNSDYFKAPSGLPLVEYALVALLEHYHDGQMDLPLIVERMAHSPARLFDIEHRGYIEEGYWADLVLVDLENGTTVKREAVISKCGWSPFEGTCFRSSVLATIVSGHLAFYKGKVRPEARGMRLRFQRPSC
jgi:dihydroorotase